MKSLAPCYVMALTLILWFSLLPSSFELASLESIAFEPEPARFELEAPFSMTKLVQESAMIPGSNYGEKVNLYIQPFPERPIDIHGNQFPGNLWVPQEVTGVRILGGQAFVDFWLNATITLSPAPGVYNTTLLVYVERVGIAPPEAPQQLPVTIIVKNPRVYAVSCIALGILTSVAFAVATAKTDANGKDGTAKPGAKGKALRKVRVAAPVLSLSLVLVLAVTELGPFLGKYPSFGTDWLDFVLAIAFGFGLGTTFENIGSKLVPGK